jgi:hypothetical protein
LRPVLRSLAGLAAAAVLPACRPALEALGGTPSAARQVADEALAGFAYRFYAVNRAPDFDRARRVMGRYALIPSRLYTDSTVWNIRRDRDRSRTLFVRGQFEGNRFNFFADPQVPYPTALGAQRHAIQLKHLGGGDYEWNTAVDHAIGSVTPAAFAAAILALFTAAEGRTGSQALADAATAFPSAARHLVQLLSIDSLRTAPLRGGATAITLSVRFRPDVLREGYPAFASWVNRYVMPTVYSVRIDARDQTPFLDIQGRDGRLTFRLAARDGRLVSLDGAGIPLPDSLRLIVDASTRYRMFRLGFTDLRATFTIERGAQQRAWVFRFQREPAWHFPLAVDKLIRNPLRRPFEGRGAELRFAVRSDLGAQTMSARSVRMVVNESAVMRWLGGLGATAFGEFTGQAEVEENRFLYGIFAALRTDILALRVP